jgi:predicted PurR-regulated permease PerM
MVLLALFVGFKIQGLVGVLFAVPVSVVLATVIQEMQRRGAPDAERSDRSRPEDEIEVTNMAVDRTD